MLIDLLDLSISANNPLLQQAMADGKQRRQFFLRRRKEGMRHPDGSLIFPERFAITVAFELAGPELDLYEAVTAYVRGQRQLASARPNRNVGFMLTVMQRRLASSVRAIARTLERRLKRLEDELAGGASALEAQARANAGWDDAEMDEDDSTDAEAEQLAEEALRFTTALTVEELRDEIQQLRGLVQQAQRTEGLHAERKLEALRSDVLDRERLFSSSQKLIIFTEHRDTLTYLREQLSNWGLNSTEIHGSMSLKARRKEQERFLDPEGDVQVLVATDAAGEGINLQKCNLMVNYDIPWNPNRLEQRMGRIHRYGQNRATYTFNLVADNTREGEVLHRLLTKIEEQRVSLGDSVYDVVGDIVSGRELTDLIWRAIENPGTIADLANFIDEKAKAENIEQLKSARDEGLAISDIDFHAIMQDEQEAKANRLMPQYVEDFFREACQLTGVRLERRPLDDDWRIPHVPAAIRQQPKITRRHGDVLTEYSRFTFHKERAMDPAARIRPAFMAPGHPLFEAVATTVERRYGNLLRRGAVLLDPDEGPARLLWMLRGRIVDGNNDTVGERVYFVTQSLDAPDTFTSAGPSPIVDLAAWTPTMGDFPADLLSGLRDLARSRDAVLGYAVDSLLMGYREEQEEERERQYGIKEQALGRSYTYLINESNERLGSHRRKQDAGRDMTLPIQNEERELERLIAERDEKTEALKRERNVSLASPEVIGVAAVLPVGVLGPRAEVPPKAPSAAQPERRPPDGGDPEVKKQVEMAAMTEAMDYERRQGRNPKDVGRENKGWDILSTDADGAIRFIEVKGSAGREAVQLTANEFNKAKTLTTDYWLYVVWNALTNPDLCTVQDPANTVAIETRVLERHIVRAEALEAVRG